MKNTRITADYTEKKIIIFFILAWIIFVPFQSGAEDRATDELFQMNLKDLMELEITSATRYTMPVKKAPAIATIITAREMRDMGAKNLKDVLRRIPGIGVNVAADIPVFSAVEIRGIKTVHSEKTLLMMDGHVMTMPFSQTWTALWADLALENIKRIEVIRGPGTALYGANAFLGVINIITKGPEENQGLQVTASGGSFDTQHYNLLFGHNRGDLKTSAYIDYQNTDGPSSHVEQDAINNSGDTLEWREKTEMGLAFAYGDFMLKGGYVHNKMGPYIGVGYALNDESKQDRRHLYADLINNKELTNGLEIKTRLYGDYFQIDTFWEILPEGALGVYSAGMTAEPIYKNRVIGGEIITEYTLSNHNLTGGMMLETIDIYDVRHITNYDPNTRAPLDTHQDISDWANFNKDSRRDVWAVYFQDVWNITDRVSFTGGLRHDHYSDFGGTTNPRVGLVWEFMQDTYLKLLYGSAFRAPGFNELNQQNNPVNKGNPNLDPEKIDTYEAGLEYRFLKYYTAIVNYFYNDLTDLIILGEKPGPGHPAKYENKGAVEVQGVETELRIYFVNGYYGYLNYSYQDPRNGDTDKRLADVSSHRANAGINLAPWKYLNANVNLSWTGKRHRAEDDKRDDLDAATLVDLTLIGSKFYKNRSLFSILIERYNI